MYVCERKGDKKVAEEADSACIDSLKFISRSAGLCRYMILLRKRYLKKLALVVLSVFCVAAWIVA